MSSTTVDIMNSHRASQIQLSPSSEEFQIVGGSTFYGIFDNSHIEDKNDSGNVQQKKRSLRIMVDTITSEMVSGASVLLPDATTKTISFNGKDENGVPILWLA